MITQPIKTNLLVEQIKELPTTELLKLLQIITQLLSQAWLKTASPVDPPKPRFGSGQHLGLVMSDDFNDPLDDFKEYMS
jgi:hypothetical protein